MMKHPKPKHRFRDTLTLLITIALGTGLSACTDPPPNKTLLKLDTELRAVIESAGLAGDPTLGRTLPSINDPLPQLGKKLFFSKALSGDKDVACASCHHPFLGGGDAMALPVGVDAENPNVLGPDRVHSRRGEDHDGGPTVPRNSPTTFNVGMWDKYLFFDGRVESLGKTPGVNGADGKGIRTPDMYRRTADPNAGPNLVVAQARFPVTSEEEMRGFSTFDTDAYNDDVRRRLAQRLGDYGEGKGELGRTTWLQEFQQAFNSQAEARRLVTFDNIVLAIGEYERSQVFVDTPWKAYVKGDPSALTVEAKRGALLFFRDASSGGAGCVMCHKGDFFTDEEFHVLAVPQFGRGTEAGFGDEDLGRYHGSLEDEDMYAFRTPTLLNVGVTWPYGHTGAYQTLQGMIRHHLNVEKAVAEFDYAKLDPIIQKRHARAYTQRALDMLKKQRAEGKTTIKDVELNDQQVADLVSFVHALTDPCVKSRKCLAPWTPDEKERDPDGHRLVAIVETKRN